MPSKDPRLSMLKAYIHHNKIVAETTLFNLPVTHVTITSNVATLTFSGPSANFFSGQQLVLGNFTTNTFLNGLTVTVNATAANSNSFSFPLVHANVNTSEVGIAGGDETARGMSCDANYIPSNDRGCYTYNNYILANNNRAVRYRSRQGRSFNNRVENASFFAFHLGDQNGQPAGVVNGQVVVATVARTSGIATLTCKTTGGAATQCLLGSWVSGHIYSIGTTILDPNGNMQTVTTGGVSAGTIPTFSTTLNATTSDNTVVWKNLGAPKTAMVQHVKNNGGDYTFDGVWPILSLTSGSLTLSQPFNSDVTLTTLTNPNGDPAGGDAEVGLPNFYIDNVGVPGNNSIVFEDYSLGIGARIDHNRIVNPFSTLTAITVRGSGWLVDHNYLEGLPAAAFFADFGGDGACAWCTGFATFRNNAVMVPSGNNIAIGAPQVYPPINISSISSNGTTASVTCAALCANDLNGSIFTTAFNAGRPVYVSGTGTAFDGQAMTVRNIVDGTHIVLNTNVANGVSAVTGVINTYYSVSACNSGAVGFDASHVLPQIGEIKTPTICP
jgi:hypothetical protein